MASKYLKNSEGIVRAVTSNNLQLEKPLLNENYDIEVHNRNMDKIDSAIQEVKGKIDGLELVASNVKMADGTTVEVTVSANKTSILNNAKLANQALTKANEAFQRGDNVKTQLVDKLISEGLEVSTNNTFEELIGNIALGKKWATGLISDSLPCYLYSPYAYFYVSINSLGFKPSTIMLCGNTGSNTRRMFYTEMIDGDSMYVWLNTSSTYMTLNISSTANGFFKISNGSFCMPLYYLQVSSVPNIKPVNTRWIAIE